MKKVIVTIIAFALLCSSVLFVSCANNNSSSSTSSSSSSSSDSSSNSTTFTVDQLKQYDGQNGNKAYVAVNGTVYDVTNAKNWKNGKHENGIVAGVDLTNELPSSPHGDSVLSGLTVVGKLN